MIEAALVASGMDAATSAEAATTILEAAWNSYLKGRTIRHERAWMARVAQRVAARRAAEFRAHAPIPHDTPSSRPSPADEAADRDQRRRDRADLRSAIATLPAPYRVAARLRLLRGWTRPRIAAYVRRRWEVGED